MDEERKVTQEGIDKYMEHLKEEEKARNTMDKYNRDLKKLLDWLVGRPLTKVLAAEWKNSLQKANYTATSVNSMLSAANGFFKWMGWDDLKLDHLKIQRKTFCDENRELGRDDYNKLVTAAMFLQKFRLLLILETICGLGLRVSEVCFITVEAARRGRAEITMKGKVRTVLISKTLSKKLLEYAKENHIVTGQIFITKTGRTLSRSQIWREMKGLCDEAGVDPEKVFPHNLRHLFARTWYDAYGNISKLADVLGHSSIETTRIYLISTGEEHARQMEQLGLVS